MQTSNVILMDFNVKIEIHIIQTTTQTRGDIAT
jgi:hypothetical protein